MTVYPGSEKPVLKKVATIEEKGYYELSFTCFTHTGTHMDAPAHILEKGKTLDKFDIHTFFGKALVINCTKFSTIEKPYIESYLVKKEIPRFLLFYTGWDQLWTTKRYFEDYPVLSKEASRFLSKLPISGIGIDAPSYDPINNRELTNHTILLKSGFILVENLCKLNRISSEEILFSCFPLKINRSDGSPVRAVAIIE